MSLCQLPVATFKAERKREDREELHVVGERETRGSEHGVDEGCKGESIHQLIFRVVLPDFTQVSG